MEEIILQLPVKTQKVTFLNLLPITEFLASVATNGFESRHPFLKCFIRNYLLTQAVCKSLLNSITIKLKVHNWYKGLHV